MKQTDFQTDVNILIWTDLGTVGLDISCLKSLTKSGHLLLLMMMMMMMMMMLMLMLMTMVLMTLMLMFMFMFPMSKTYLAFGLRKRQLMSHMNGPSRGLIATFVYMVMVMVMVM